MQSKGAIKLLAVLLALACIYQLSFTFKTRSVEKKAAEYAAQFPVGQQSEAEQHYLDSVQNVGVYNLGFKKFTYKECKEKELNLGLDLKGGMNVMLEVQVEDVVKALAGDSQHDPAFVGAIAEANARGSGVASLKGKTVGVQTGSTHEAYARTHWASHGVKIVGYANQDNVYLDLLSGRIDASLQDNIQAATSFVDTPRGQKFAFAGPVISDGSISSDVGIAVNKDNPALRDALNEAIKQIRAMQRRLITRPTLGSRRAIIINPADDLEKSAANALLKVLEEPPEGVVFVLITHRLQQLFPPSAAAAGLCRWHRRLPKPLWHGWRHRAKPRLARSWPMPEAHPLP